MLRGTTPVSVVSPHDTCSTIHSKMLLSSSNQITHPIPKTFHEQIFPAAKFQQDKPEP